MGMSKIGMLLKCLVQVFLGTLCPKAGRATTSALNLSTFLCEQILSDTFAVSVQFPPASPFVLLHYLLLPPSRVVRSHFVSSIVLLFFFLSIVQAFAFCQRPRFCVETCFLLLCTLPLFPQNFDVRRASPFFYRQVLLDAIIYFSQTFWLDALVASGSSVNFRVVLELAAAVARHESPKK